MAPLLAGFLIFLAVLFLVGIGAMVGAWKLIMAVSRRALPRKAESPALASAPDPELHRYPERLEGLEAQLEGSIRASEGQIVTLAAKRDEISAKPGREELAQRYTQDLELLKSQTETTHRVLATIWKTRAVLALRIHLAAAARKHPELDHLPQPVQVRPDQLDHAARLYAVACREVRDFVDDLDSARSRVYEVVPAPSIYALVEPPHRDEVDQEARKVERSLLDLRERMDNLADTLDYLSNRFRTQKVVEGTSGATDLGPEAGRLLQEIARAVGELDQLTQSGEQSLADVAVDGLAGEIANLEKVGLDINLQADAEREVERLLASFTRVPG